MTLHSDGLEHDPAPRSLEASPPFVSSLALQHADGGNAEGGARPSAFELETVLAVAGVALVGLALFYLRADDAQTDALTRLADAPAVVEAAAAEGDPAAEVRALAGEVAVTEPSAAGVTPADAAAEVETLASEHAEPAPSR